MRKIGGMFHYEPSTPIENGYFSSISSPNDDLAFTMSGRCGIYYCLQEIACHDMRKVAYVPLYTCETVLAPFEKAGYQLKFYESTRICTAFLILRLLMKSVFYLFAATMAFATMITTLLKPAKKKEL